MDNEDIQGERGRTQSRMSRIVGTPEYQQMTIRSWATTTKLLGLLEARRSG